MFCSDRWYSATIFIIDINIFFIIVVIVFGEVGETREGITQCAKKYMAEPTKGGDRCKKNKNKAWDHSEDKKND